MSRFEDVVKPVPFFDMDETPVPEEDQVIDSKEDKELDNGKYDW